MMLRASVLLVTLLSVMATACSPGTAGPGTGSTASAPSGTASQDDRTLTIAVGLEVATLAGRGMDASAGNARQNLPPLLFHAGLTQQDEAVTPRPYLSDALPQLGTDAWKVFPDGRMETTWHLRPNLTWHDGAPLVADDFVLTVQARMALKTDATIIGGGLAAVVDSAAAPDSSTLVIQWKSTFPQAGVSDWQPLPRHILGETFDRGMTLESFGNLPYWTTEFVGAGPYQVTNWERGAFIEGSAFPGYVHGQPRIKHIKLTWISDRNTAVANLLSGAIHMAANGAIVSEQAPVLKREWAASGVAGSVWLSPDNSRYMAPQYRPEYSNPKALGDLRVRQAFAYGIDKQALVDVLLGGEPGIADTALSPLTPYFPELDKVLTKYPLDLQRSGQLVAEAGFTKDAEGFYGQNGTRLSAEIAAIADGRGDREATILADSFKRAGLETPIKIVPPAEARSNETISTYPAFSLTGVATGAVLGGDSITNKFVGSLMSTAANGWNGLNKVGYSDPEYDRLFRTISTTLDVDERNQAQVQAEKLLSDRAVYYPLYYNYGVLAYVASLEGPHTGLSTPDSSAVIWKINEWRWR